MEIIRNYINKKIQKQHKLAVARRNIPKMIQLGDCINVTVIVKLFPTFFKGGGVFMYKKHVWGLI